MAEPARGYYSAYRPKGPKRQSGNNDHSMEGITRGPDLVHSTTTLGPLAQLFDRFPLVTRLIALREDYVAQLSSSSVEEYFTR
jgi:hypothetical protein